ncbi:MAG: beta-ketoacyl-ACP synthase III [Dehalococcoidia bacterium]
MEDMIYAQVAGWGMSVPSRIITNEDIVKMGLDTSDEWIQARTGIKERHVVAQGEATSDLAVKAAQQALDTANVRAPDVDLIIVATSTPDHLLPSTAALVQDRLGAGNAGALDINAACSGFTYGIALGSAQIESGRAKQVLIVGADTLSSYLNWEDRATCILFGDGAGALLLQASQEPGVLSTNLGSDGSGGGLLIIPAGGSRLPPNGAATSNGDHYLKMNGRQVFRFATQIMEKAATKAIQTSGLKIDDIDLFIPHQANMRIIETVTKRLGLNMDKVFVNLDSYGNTSAASIPIALCEAIEQGRVSPGDHIMLTSFGAGLSWASTVIRWGTPLPVRRSLWRRSKQQVSRRTVSVRSSLRRQRRRVRALFERVLRKGDG